MSFFNRCPLFRKHRWLRTEAREPRSAAWGFREVEEACQCGKRRWVVE